MAENGIDFSARFSGEIRKLFCAGKPMRQSEKGTRYRAIILHETIYIKGSNEFGEERWDNHLYTFSSISSMYDGIMFE